MIFSKLKSKVVRKVYYQKLYAKLADADANSNKPRSAIFYTTHKCASTFIERLFELILKNSDYTFIDYAQVIARAGDKLDVGTPYEAFLERAYSDLYSLQGKIYGPQRKPLDFPGRNKFKHIFFLRDPRDVLVSSYFSFGFTHPQPLNTTDREKFVNKRKNIQEREIDDYALDEAKTWIIPLYEQYKYLRDTSETNIYLKYNLFVENTPEFIQNIIDFLTIDPTPKNLNLLIKEANPVQNVEVMKHKRSGKTDQYLEKLHPNTVEKLNHILAKTLADWEFEL